MATRPGVICPSSCTKAARAFGRFGFFLRRPFFRFAFVRRCPGFSVTAERTCVTFPRTGTTVAMTVYDPAGSVRLNRPVRPTSRTAATVPSARLIARTSASALRGAATPSDPANTPGFAAAASATGAAASTARVRTRTRRMARLYASPGVPAMMSSVDSDAGDELDYRFSLANESRGTFLAWIRTSLALVAGGLAAAKLLDFDSEVLRWVVAGPPIVAGAAMAADAVQRWRRYEAAMRAGVPLPTGRGLAGARLRGGHLRRRRAGRGAHRRLTPHVRPRRGGGRPPRCAAARTARAPT